MQCKYLWSTWLHVVLLIYKVYITTGQKRNIKYAVWKVTILLVPGHLKKTIHKNFSKCFKGPASIQIFTKVKLQCVYNYSLKFQLSWLLCILLKYTLNGTTSNDTLVTYDHLHTKLKSFKKQIPWLAWSHTASQEFPVFIPFQIHTSLLSFLKLGFNSWVNQSPTMHIVSVVLALLCWVSNLLSLMILGGLCVFHFC